jgi:hypothetical protein
MPNSLNPWDEPKTSSISPELGTRLFFGAVLVIFGLIVGGAVLWQLKQIVYGPNEPALVTRLSPASADDLAILINQSGQTPQTQRIQLPPKTLNVIGYFFCVIALWASSTIAYATISGGVKLLLCTNPQKKNEVV